MRPRRIDDAVDTLLFDKRGQVVVVVGIHGEEGGTVCPMKFEMRLRSTVILEGPQKI
jgi:hypothetical protein